MSELNTLEEEVSVTIDDPSVMTVNIDDTLSVSGEAADAKAVGDALALKADAAAVTAITVNGEGADNQGHIIIDGGDIKMSGSDNTTLTAAITAAAGRTAAEIPMSSAAGAQTVSQAISEISSGITGLDATGIMMASGSTVSVASKISAMDTIDTANTAAIEALQAKAGDTITLVTGGTETVKQAIEKRVLAVNGETPDATGNVTVTNTLTADNLTSSSTQTSAGEWNRRTAGGTATVSDGSAWMSTIRGNRVHTGYVPEVLEMTVNATGDAPITATINRDTFVAYVEDSGTTTLSYTTEWSEDPADYGVTVTGTPENGDSIVIEYVKEERGTIVQAKPERLVATGYNLLDRTVGYAVALKYSTDYGFAITGTYTAVKWAATATSDSKTTITPVDGLFNIPASGYIFVEGSDTNTMVFMTWSDWILSSDRPAYAAYSESTVELSELFDEEDPSAPFPYGLLRAGDVRDEINFNTGIATSNVQRLAYSSANLATAKSSGRTYEYDENYIYLERASAVTTEIDLDGEYTVDDHGLEYFVGTDVDLYAEVVYGNNLKSKLERDVLTISQQTLSAAEKSQVQSNLGLVPTTATDKTAAGFVADARVINTLNTKIASQVASKSITVGTTSSYGITLPGSGAFMIYATSSNILRCWMAIVVTYSAGATYVLEVAKGTGVTLTAGTNLLTVSTTTSGSATVNVFSNSAAKLDEVGLAS